MKACLLRSTGRIETNPLDYTDAPDLSPQPGQVLVRVKTCGVCRTDLHVIEGELPPRKSPLIPGHQVVGVVEKSGPGARRFPLARAIRQPWLHATCGVLCLCSSGRENLCDTPVFTGWAVDGGYAEYALAPEAFVYPIPEGFADEQAAPLLCAGIIGFRSFRLSGLSAGAKLGIYGFGAAAHVLIQVARHLQDRCLRLHAGRRHQKLAMEIWARHGPAEPSTRRPSRSTPQSFLRRL